MSIQHFSEFRDPVLVQGLLSEIRAHSHRRMRLMEVCGTHTVAIFRSGIRGMLPDGIELLSGPGCPVCVTAQGEIDAFIALSREPKVTITTFGDLMRVPGSHSSLVNERANGRDVRVVYSSMDALKVAQKHPDRQVVFLGVGFETTAPTVAAALIAARQMGLKNFSVFSAHKRVPPALAALLASPQVAVDGFILPGHVSVILGQSAYEPLVQKYKVPCAIAGFEPVDILQAVSRLVALIEAATPAVENAYPRAVLREGNVQARKVMDTVFETGDANWRGLGMIAASGMPIGAAFADFDANLRFSLPAFSAPEPPGCACAQILTGVKRPPQCPLYKRKCTPMAPVGPCMVSSEGVCAAYYRYHADDSAPV